MVAEAQSERELHSHCKARGVIQKENYIGEVTFALTSLSNASHSCSEKQIKSSTGQSAVLLKEVWEKTLDVWRHKKMAFLILLILS